ncbi:MAG TPA: hypothetical protein VEM32_04655 [Geobacteraceae bacterium]|nr:hypothetical protein [Geobacteraceae bacterium]
MAPGTTNNDTKSRGKKIRHAVFGAPKHLHDKKLLHTMSLIPILAWVGLGADGLSSSAYGPEEAFRALGSHTYLALLLAAVMALTVFLISYAYSRIIEHFPHGGGGYIVATHLLGEKAGVVSGSALLVDYVMTITISIASCCDAVFSYLPVPYHHYKVPFACFLIVMLVYGVSIHSDRLAPAVSDFGAGIHRDVSTIGVLGIFLLFLRAYSLGGGT